VTDRGTAGVLAHGVGTRADLPIPTWLALYASGAVVLISFMAVALLWRTSKLADADAGRPLPAGLQRVLQSEVPRRIVQVLALCLGAVVTVVAFTGSKDPPTNIAPWVLYVTFWVGLIPASLLLGPVWQYANPLRLLHRIVAPLVGRPPAGDKLDGLGMWPASLSLFAFVWLELVYPDRSTPSRVGLFIVVYATVHLMASLWFGAGWFERGDGFEVYSSLIARLSPWGVRRDGRWVARNPLRNAASRPDRPGLAAVALVLIGSTAFDGLSRTEYWTSGPGAANDILSGTAGLVVMIAVAATLYLAGTRMNGVLARQDPGTQPRAYAHSIVPIALGYAVAHYFSLLVLDGQTTWILASNPFDRPGVDLFGTYGNAINYNLVSTSAIAYVQVGAIVTGHVLGVFLAHDRALRGVTGVRSSFEQLPLVAVMVAFTVGGLGLLFGA
jgi:hypothetical protein